MKAEKVNIKDLYYKLPQENIALYPLQERDSSKLLVFDPKKGIIHSNFSNLADYLPDNSLLAFNKTKVISARLIFQKPTGGNIELLLLEPSGEITDHQQALAACRESEWNCIIGGKRVKEGMILNTQNADLNINALILSKEANQAKVRFYWDADIPFAQIISNIGNIPLPPYIKRDVEASDQDSYQTVYAKHDGSVAAPTAGLHFTDNILKKLRGKNISEMELTLHVGLGTFLPVQSDEVSDHKMHDEKIIIKKSELKSLINFIQKPENDRGLLVATGTTSVRTLESLYWHSVKVKAGISEPENLSILQWEVYELSDKFTFATIDVLKYLLKQLDDCGKEQIVGSTSLMIVPGFEFKLVEALITNFHLPESTLLMLISAFVGNDNRKNLYQEALEHNYRFLSYGDSSLLFRK